LIGTLKKPTPVDDVRRRSWPESMAEENSAEVEGSDHDSL
jgi:hypothetical protein